MTRDVLSRGAVTTPTALTRRQRPRGAAFLASIGLLGASIAAVPGIAVGAATNPKASQVTLTLYNGQHQQTTDALIQGFEARYPNITVKVRSDDEDAFDEEIVQEGAKSPADVFFTENSPALDYLQERGLLVKLNASTLAKTPAKYNSPQGDWVGVSARVSVLIYNPNLIKKSQLPTTALGLANPKYKGKLAFAAGETDFQPIVTSMLRAYGKAKTIAWLNGLKANGAAHSYPDNETIVDEVNRGAVAFGLVNQYYWYRMQAEIGKSNMHSEIVHFAPHDPGYVVDVAGAGILKTSRHQAAAQEFVAYLVSKAGQEIIATPSKSISFEYPIASGVTTKAPETPFNQLQPNSIDLAELGDGSTAVALLHEVQLL